MRLVTPFVGLSFIVLAVVAGGASRAHAHETWMLPSTFTPSPNAEVSFTLSSGMDFPHDETAIAPERLERHGLRWHDGTKLETTKLRIGERGEHALNLHARVGTSGVAQAYVTLHPRDIDLDASQIEHYFEEIGASQELRDTWERVKGSTAWHETYTKYAKCVLVVGDATEPDAPADEMPGPGPGAPSGDASATATTDAAWSKPLGLALELVLLDDPRSMTAGDDVRFRLLRDGKPLVGQPVGRSVEGRGSRRFETTDENGEVTFPMSRSGRVLIFSTDLRYVDRDSKWVSRFATMTLQVASRDSAAGG